MNSKGASTKSLRQVETDAPAGPRSPQAKPHHGTSHGRTTPSRETARPRPAQAKESAVELVYFSSPLLTLVCLPSPEHAQWTLAGAAQHAGVHPELLLYYCRLGLLGPERAQRGASATFDRAALEEVARIEHYRRHLGVQRQALAFVCAMRREGIRRKIELRFLEASGLR